MNLITTHHPTPAESCAHHIIARLNEQLQSRIEAHRHLHDVFWNRDNTTPEEILAALGPHASLFVACADESLRHLRALADLAGKPFSDLLPDHAWTSKGSLVVHPDGTVKLTPPAAD
jgi:hypothetical protein